MATNNEIERRGLFRPVEIRQDEDGAVSIVGYAAVFDQEADIAGVFSEVIARGAFDDVIGRDNVPLLINHDGLPLARTRSDTLRLSVDDRGLRIESDLDMSDPDVARVIPKMKRGDLDKMSFAFRVGVQEWDDTVDPPLRTIKKIDRLYDVSIVTEPAYEGTEVGLRSLELARKEQKQTAYSFRKRRMKRDLALLEREG